jgi:ribosome recycling factor
MIDDVLHEATERMNKTIESLRHDFMTIRTGRATPALVDGIKVDYYGVPTPLQQLATISIPEAQQILIKPYSKGDMHMIEKAIATSDLGLTPNNDGQAIRLNIPSLNEERRRELTKVVNKRTEEARVAVRNIRRDAIHDLKEFEKEHLISEDDLELGEKRVQEKTDAMIKRVDELAREKDVEIMTV